MNLRKNMQYIKICLFALLCIGTMTSCLSDGEETYVLEEPNLTASQMIIGGWKVSEAKILDENGNEVPASSLGNEFETEFEEELTNAPEVQFDEDGNYTVTYPGNNGQGGSSTSGSWNISDDESYLHMGNTDWEIQSFGKNKLVLIRTYYYNGMYYYIVYIYIRTSSPETTPGGDGGEGGDGNIPGLGDVSDNNPYKPYDKNLISKITLNRHYTDKNTTTKTIYTFQYDQKSRIMAYTEESTNVKGITETHKFNFTYDNNKVYLYMDGKIINNGTIGANGYLTNLYEGNTSNVNSTFTYDAEGLLTQLKVNGSSSNWAPSYDYAGNMISPQPNGDQLNYSHDIFNKYSVNLTGLFTSCYQWEWFMHLDYAGVAFGLFDFYGKRGDRIAWRCQRGTHWTDEITDWEGGMNYDPTSSDRLTYVQITRTGINSPFVAEYEIEYAK